MKMNLEAEMQKKALMKDGKGEDLELMEDPVPVLTKRHFEYGLANCRMSVSETDLNRYEEFKRKFDPNFSSSKTGTKLNWPDDNNSRVVQNQNKVYDDLDIYS